MDGEVLGLAALAYEAAVEPGRWQAFIERLSAACRGSGVLFVQDFETAENNVFCCANYEPGWIEAYGAHYAAANPWLPHVARLQAGAVATGETLVRRDEFERGEFYNDFLRPQRLDHVIGAVLQKEDTVSTNVSVI